MEQEKEDDTADASSAAKEKEGDTADASSAAKEKEDGTADAASAGAPAAEWLRLERNWYGGRVRQRKTKKHKCTYVFQLYNKTTREYDECPTERMNKIKNVHKVKKYLRDKVQEIAGEQFGQFITEPTEVEFDEALVKKPATKKRKKRKADDDDDYNDDYNDDDYDEDDDDEMAEVAQVAEVAEVAAEEESMGTEVAAEEESMGTEAVRVDAERRAHAASALGSTLLGTTDRVADPTDDEDDDGDDKDEKCTLRKFPASFAPPSKT